MIFIGVFLCLVDSVYDLIGLLDLVWGFIALAV